MTRVRPSASYPLMGGSGRRRTAVTIVVATLLSGCAGSDDDAQEHVDLTEELAAANIRADAAEVRLDELAIELEAVGGIDPERVASTMREFDEVNEALALARADVVRLTRRAETAETRLAEIEEIAGQFPISLDSSLIPEDIPGNYRITFQEAYCDGFTNCGRPPAEAPAEIYFTPERFLRIKIEGILDAGLFALDGSLYGITDSFTALPPCGETPRRARMTITMYAGAVSVQGDGTRSVEDLNASITVDAPAEGPDCPSGLVFFASSMIPQT